MAESKYRTILEAKSGELEALKDKAIKDSWQPIYHIHPQYGLMNDPNGLVQLNGEYHVFYQWYPYGAMHGMKHWAHVKSTDLVTWERLPVALTPTEEYESHGAYSGGAIKKDGQGLLFYTGNVKYEDGSRSANQCIAMLKRDGSVEKYTHNPAVRGVPDGYTGHVRDPKVWKENDTYYMLLGAQRENETGALIVYESSDALQWSFKGEVQTSLPDFGYMWECPDYFKLDGKDVFVFSPQGIKADGHDFHNIYNVIYAVGIFDVESLTFEMEYYREIDKGFDFYAPQTFQDESGRRLLFAWIGNPDVDYPSDEYGWAHALTLPRELSLEGNELVQKPVEELNKLRDQAVHFRGTLKNEEVIIDEATNNAYEINMTFREIGAKQFGLELFNSKEEELRLVFDTEKQEVRLDRSSFHHQYATEYGVVRSEKWTASNEVDVRVFVDKSIVEIYINGGKIVFTSRVFPKKDSKSAVNVFAEGSVDYRIDYYGMSRGIS
ncbi:sucrose-6-phosphate hydrolase [Priestia aryabhattai]|uniref:glycoside hydrolase family 32 protein n=1 Tax=Priestia aryabhattai TaxID=412384 RepID=UPI002E221DB9|nr:sucrose-6-phosphate hydrolase [Priestia aryabhattai]MED4007283.1 sucrose-6-phosphate hydrolase [Priestia aryabhattai]